MQPSFYVSSACDAAFNLINRAAEHRWARAVRRGLLFCLPLVILGAATVLISHFPLAAYQRFMLEVFGSQWKSGCDQVWQATFGITALAMICSISHALAQGHPRNLRGDISPAIVAAIALASFIAIVNDGSSHDLLLDLGNRGAFAAIVTAIAATEIFLWLSSKRLTPVRWFGHDADPALPHALAALLPGALTILTLFACAQGFGLVTIWLSPNLDSWGFTHLAGPDHLVLGAIVTQLLIHLFWFFGIHGNIALDPLTNAHFSAAQALTDGFFPLGMFSKTFYDVFIYQGGSGCTLALLIAALLMRAHAGSARIAKVAFPCALVNINEPVLFGLPVVLNPFFLIPFLLTPLMLLATSILAVSSGLVPPPIHAVEWTTPPLLGGWAATGSWRGAALQACNLALGTMIYLPFVRLAENAREMQNSRAFNALVNEVRKENNAVPQELIRQDDIGNLARLLAADLERDVAAGRLYLEYQPQTDIHGKALGVEALLRWRHPVYGQIPPFLAIHLAEENNSITMLGRWVIIEACKQLGIWNRSGITGLRMSINLSTHQLKDPGLLATVSEAITANGLNPGDIELEITETCEVASSDDTVITQLAGLGIRLAIDDFGMGYSSILYLRRFAIHTIKIDGSLTRDVLKNNHCQDIIMSMATLCRASQTEVVAEYVETREQLKTLYGLGCQSFQGFLFSKPLLPEACAQYIRISREKTTR